MRANLLERLEKHTVPEPNSGCWLWVGSHAGGYGRIKVDGKTVATHRLSYELRVGPIPAGCEIDHLCRTPWCVNPEHLEAVTHRENMLRGVSLGKMRLANLGRTHCAQGHEFTEASVYLDSKGHRRCRICRRIRNREQYWRDPAKARRRGRLDYLRKKGK